MEEVLFRGIALRLLDDWLGTWSALLITSVIFGFIHIANPGNGLWSSVVSTAVCLVVAAVLFDIAWKRGHIRPVPRRETISGRETISD